MIFLALTSTHSTIFFSRTKLQCNRNVLCSLIFNQIQSQPKEAHRNFELAGGGAPQGSITKSPSSSLRLDLDFLGLRVAAAEEDVGLVDEADCDRRDVDDSDVESSSAS
jgi:hypothetical protein